MLHQIKAPQFYCDLGLQRLLNPPVNGKIQGLFKAFECFSGTFQGKFNFQGLFKTVLYIQVFFKPVRTLIYMQFQALYSPKELSHNLSSAAIMIGYIKCFYSFLLTE